MTDSAPRDAMLAEALIVGFAERPAGRVDYPRAAIRGATVDADKEGFGH